MENIEELLDLLEESTKEKKVVTKEIDSFINQFNISEGSDKIPNYIIYYTYCNYVEKPYGKTHFFRLFNKHFKSYRTNKQRYYLLNKESFDYSHEGLLKAEKHNYDKKKRL